MFYYMYATILLVLLFILLAIWREEVKARNSMAHGLANKYWVLRERRRFVRFDKEMNIRYNLVDDKQNNRDTKTVNISRKGLCISSYAKLKEKDVIALEIEVPGFSKTVKAVGKVMWIRELRQIDKEGHRIFYAGIEFSKIDPDSEAILLTHLNTLRPLGA